MLKSITLQMFTGVYRVFTGKSECGDFKFMGIACYLQSRESKRSGENYDIYTLTCR